MAMLPEMEIVHANCLKLSNIYYRTIQMLDGSKLPNEEYDTWNALVFRILSHSLSALSLLKGTEVKELSFANYFIDASSIMVLSRSAIEVYANFYYLFLDPQSIDDERIFRIKYFSYRGLMIRQKPTDPIYEFKRKKEKRLLEDALSALKSTSTYNALNTINKNKLKDGRYEHISKTRMIINSGFAEDTAKLAYSVLSDYVHGGYISSLQISQATDRTRQETSSQIAFYFLSMVLSLMTNNIVKKFTNINFEYTDEERQLFESMAKIAGT